jgi:hypothetical protein
MKVGSASRVDKDCGGPNQSCRRFAFDLWFAKTLSVGWD